MEAIKTVLRSLAIYLFLGLHAMLIIELGWIGVFAVVLVFGVPALAWCRSPIQIRKIRSHQGVSK